MTDRSGVVPQLLGAAVGIVLGSALLFALLGMLRDDDPTPEVVAGSTPSAAATTEPTGAPSPEPTVSGPAPTETATAPSPTATEEPEPTDEPASVDPAEISIQVLDAVGGDGGAAARAVADELREAGYDVVVVNRAGRQYDATTVFWSPGQEVGGQQVAAAIGAARAEATPDEVRLSDSVDVHVVVGADRT